VLQHGEQRSLPAEDIQRAKAKLYRLKLLIQRVVVCLQLVHFSLLAAAMLLKLAVQRLQPRNMSVCTRVHVRVCVRVQACMDVCTSICARGARGHLKASRAVQVGEGVQSMCCVIVLLKQDMPA